MIKFTRNSSIEEFIEVLPSIDFICHTAGVNRPEDDNEFERVNANLTKRLCIELQKVKKNIPIIFTSSVHVKNKNSYGASKLAAEKYLLDFSKNHSSHLI